MRMIKRYLHNKIIFKISGNRFPTIVASICFLVSIFSLLPAHAQKSKKTNVLLILSDDHSVPYLGVYGNPDLKTPNIDRITKEGVRFDHAYTSAPQCVSSRASIMTGRSVVDIRMLRFSAPLNRDIITYPELLKKEGYYTGVCGRSYHLDGSYSRPKETAEAFEEYQMETFPDRLDYVKKGNDDQAVEQFKEFLDQKGKDQPFFMQACFSDPHRPFTAADFEPDPSTLTIPEGMPDTPLLREDLAAHYGELQRLDYHVGQLLEELEERKMLDNTLVIFMGDNGAALLRGKGTLYDCGVHVPLVARYPKLIKPGTVSDILISGEDLGPTILDFAGVAPDPKMTGLSFLSAFKGDDKEILEYAYSVRGSHGSGLPGSSRSFDLSRSVFNKEYRLIYNPLFHLPYDPNDFSGQEFWKDLITQNERGNLPEVFSQTYIFTDERPMFELYDLKNDPHEFNNVYGQDDYAAIENELKALLHKWMIVNQDVVPLPIPPLSKGH